MEELLRLLLQEPPAAAAWYGGALASATGRSHTIVGTSLNRLEAAGLVKGRMERLEEATDRAPRRYFTITDKGVRFVRQLAERKQAEGASLLRLALGYQTPG